MKRKKQTKLSRRSLTQLAVFATQFANLETVRIWGQRVYVCDEDWHGQCVRKLQEILNDQI